MKTNPTDNPAALTHEPEGPCAAAFAWWSNKRGVWPRLTHEEVFQAGWEACATRLWEVCTTDNESKDEFIARIKSIIHQNADVDAPAPPKTL